jgi:hypothetical protein
LVLGVGMPALVAGVDVVTGAGATCRTPFSAGAVDAFDVCEALITSETGYVEFEFAGDVIGVAETGCEARAEPRNIGKDDSEPDEAGRVTVTVGETGPLQATMISVLNHGLARLFSHT